MNTHPILGIYGKAGSGKDTAADRLIEHHGFCRVSFADPLKRFAMDVFDFSETTLWGDSDLRNKRDNRYTSYCLHKGLDKNWRLASDRYEQHAETWLDDVMPNAVKDRDKVRQDLDTWFHWLGTHYGSKLSPRIVLQTLGTEFGRSSLGHSVWVDYAIQVSKTLLAGRDAHGNFVDYSQPDGLFVSDSPNSYKGVVLADVRYQNEFDAVHMAGGSTIKIVRDSIESAVGIDNHSSETALDHLDPERFGMVVYNNKSIGDLHQTVDFFVNILDRANQ